MFWAGRDDRRRINMVIRDYRREDLAQVLTLWQRDHDEGARVAIDQLVRLVDDDRAIVLVAESEGQIVGAALAGRSPVMTWLYRLSAADGAAEEETIAERLLEEVESRSGLLERLSNWQCDDCRGEKH
jgi:hypothetical protein